MSRPVRRRRTGLRPGGPAVAIAVVVLGCSLLLVLPSAFVSGSPSGSKPRQAPGSGAGGAQAAAFPVKGGAPAALTAQNAVDPYAHYTAEPAPLGIADFGVAPDGSPYSYSTTAFVGTAQLNGFVTYNRNLTSFGIGQNDESTLQLNVLLYFSSGSQSFAFWIQDVLDLRTLNRTTQFEDNIWNMTAGSSGLVLSSTVRGNGSFVDFGGGSGLYVDVAGALPGNAVDLNRSSTIELQVVSAVVNGTPQVEFEYLDGYGWQIFDTASFAFTHSVGSAGFRVDGGAYVLGNLYDDAELVFGGPGGGSTTRVVGGSANLSLAFDNGHNLETVQNAYNFGSDTAETVSHGTGQLGSASAGSPPFAALAPGSRGLAELYNASLTGRLVVRSSVLSSGAIELGPGATEFRGAVASLAVVPGSAPIALVNGSQVLDSGNVSILAGQTTYLILPFPRVNVTFREQGLPGGTDWSVALGTSGLGGSSSALTLRAKNGTYDYRVGPVPGFTTDAWAGTVVVIGSDVEVPVVFRPFVYEVSFVESDLPPGTLWTVSLAGAERSSTDAAIGFLSANGTYNFTATSVYAYLGEPANGSITVAAASVQQIVLFTIRPGTLDGSVTPADSVVLLEGAALPVRDGRFAANLTPGTYQLEAMHAGYLPQFQNVTISAGNVSSPFFQLHPRATPGTAGMTGSVAPWLALGVAAAAAGAAAIALWVRRSGQRRR